MYKALKSAQNEIHTTLLKFTDDVVELQQQSSNGDSTPNGLANAVQLLHAKQDIQFRVLNGAIESLNENMCKIVALLSDSTVNAVTVNSTIPSMQPRATTEEMNDVVSSIPTPIPATVKTVSVPAISVHAAPLPPVPSSTEVKTPPTEVSRLPPDTLPVLPPLQNLRSEGSSISYPAVVAAVALVPAEDSLSEIEVEDEDVDLEEVEVEEVEVEEDEVEEDLEVEEWTYKGRIFFKDSNNTVYANDSGEVGDAIGNYDPVKNILKKI